MAVFSWGYGADGQTGHSTLFNCRLPRRVESLDGQDIVSVCCGASWSTATSRAGQLFVWGYGDGGWLGLGRPVTQAMPNFDCDAMAPAETIGGQHVHIRSFDSRHSGGLCADWRGRTRRCCAHARLLQVVASRGSLSGRGRP